ncbi:galectin-7-like isoform X2 [Pelodiscus sinensis]|uniref:galectin-7-like isoform X2 n=1 Tax=Pelodiscus sinensis TaxID=13735 RepID=UPI003F6D7096
MVTAAMALIPDKLTIPYSMAFPEGLWPPTWVKIQGSVPETSTGFQVKFLRGQYKEANVALLFSHCFQGSSHILLNSLVEKKWGQEQREDNSPLCKGGSFTLMFTITDKEYQAVPQALPRCIQQPAQLRAVGTGDPLWSQAAGPSLQP